MSEEMNFDALEFTNSEMNNYEAAWKAMKAVAMFTKNKKLMDMMACLESEYRIESSAIIKNS